MQREDLRIETGTRALTDVTAEVRAFCRA